MNSISAREHFNYPPMHWLLGWANRIDSLLQDEEWRPRRWDAMIFQPCHLARQEMIQHAANYPGVINILQDALRNAEKCYQDHADLLPPDACPFCGKMGENLDEDPIGYLFCHWCGERTKLAKTPPHEINLAAEAVSEAFLYLMNVIRESVQAIEQAEAGADTPKLVTIQWVAEMVHIERTSMTRYTREWGEPDVKGAGRRPAQYEFQRILPTLQKQFPGVFSP